MTTLSKYNNNPGNIRPAKGVTYEGMIGVDDKGFAVFESPKYGQQALTNDLTHKLEKRGINTPDAFVDAYCPPGKENSEESRDNYKMYIAHKMGLKSTDEKFPENAVPKLAEAVTHFEGGTWQNEGKEEGKASTEETVKSADEGERVEPIDTSTIEGTDEAIRGALGATGALTGAHVAGTIEAGKQLVPLIPNAVNRIRHLPENPNKPSTRGSLQRYLSSQIPENLNLKLSDLEKEVNAVTGADKKIRTMSEVQGALNEIKGEPASRTAKVVSRNPATGMERKIWTNNPGKPAIDLTKYESTAGPVARAARADAEKLVNLGKAVVPSAARVGIGALGGLGAGMNAYDASKKFAEEGWTSPRGWTKSAAALGGGLMMIPTPWTEIGGAILQVPELAAEGYDYLTKPKEPQKHAKGGLSGG